MSVGLAPKRSASSPPPTRPAIEARPEMPNTVAAAMTATPWSVACVTMWKIGPECAAQHAKWVSAMAQNCGAASTSRVVYSRRLAQQQRDGHDDEPRQIAEHQHRDAPVPRARQRARQRRDQQNAETDARGDERDGQAAPRR